VLVTSVCLAFSALFELLEWWAALLAGRSVDFLATQGDVWDTQWDMFLALCGAVVSQLLFARWHDRQLFAVDDPTPPRARTLPGRHAPPES
jgi:putative membrane protein